jgi:hypothetical protein
MFLIVDKTIISAKNILDRFFVFIFYLFFNNSILEKELVSQNVQFRNAKNLVNFGRPVSQNFHSPMNCNWYILGTEVFSPKTFMYSAVQKTNLYISLHSMLIPSFQMSHIVYFLYMCEF